MQWNDRYTKLKSISQNPYTSLWKCKDEKTGKTVVVKQSCYSEDNYFDEAKILRLLQDCPGIPILVDSYDNVVVIEYIPGMDVIDMINEGLMTHSHLTYVFKKICEILEVVHALGIVHRDIKLENMR